MLNKEQIKYKRYLSILKRELLLQGKTEKTAESYIRSFNRAAAFFQCCPDQLTTEQLKTYFAELLTRYAWSTVKVDRCGLQFFFKYVLNQKWEWVEIIKPPRIKKLPDILSVNEIHTLLKLVKKQRYRACLFALYSMGLRISEGLALQVGDFDKDRMLVHIRNGKGHKDRFVPLPLMTRLVLAEYWITHKNPVLLFPSMQSGLSNARHTSKMMDCAGLRSALKAVLLEARISRKITVHSLRHSYATHLVELGVNLSVIQKYLGHKSPITTVVYTHLSRPAQDNSVEIINKHMTTFFGLS